VITTSNKRGILPAVIGGGVLGCAMILAAILVIWWRFDAVSYTAVQTTSETDAMSSGAYENPVYKERAPPTENILYRAPGDA